MTAHVEAAEPLAGHGQPGFNNFEVLDAIRAEVPDFSVHLGDALYRLAGTGQHAFEHSPGDELNPRPAHRRVRLGTLRCPPEELSVEHVEASRPIRRRCPPAGQLGQRPAAEGIDWHKTADEILDNLATYCSPVTRRTTTSAP